MLALSKISLVSGRRQKVVPRQRVSHAKRGYQVVDIKIRAEARPYELVGICDRGIDYLYRPVYCDASNVIPHGTGVEFDERCTTKGDYIDAFHSRIMMTGERSIVLSRTPTKSGGGYSPSPKLRYIRCNQAYSCRR